MSDSTENRPSLYEELKTSSYRFFQRSLDAYERLEYSFSLVDAMTAAELLLKSSLAQRDEARLFEDGRRSRTVKPQELRKRVRQAGIELTPEDCSLLVQLGEWRNNVVHFIASTSADEHQQHLGQLYDFILRFSRMVFGDDLREVVPRSKWNLANSLSEEWKQVVEEAREEARAGEGQVDAEHPCPVCGSVGVVTRDEENDGWCHLCEEYRSYAPCTGCGNASLSNRPREPHGDEYCADCIEAAGDAYIQQHIDIMRGK